MRLCIDAANCLFIKLISTTGDLCNDWEWKNWERKKEKVNDLMQCEIINFKKSAQSAIFNPTFRSFETIYEKIIRADVCHFTFFSCKNSFHYFEM